MTFGQQLALAAGPAGAARGGADAPRGKGHALMATIADDLQAASPPQDAGSANMSGARTTRSSPSNMRDRGRRSAWWRWCCPFLMRLQLGFPGEFQFIQPENYLQFVTMHGMIMVVYLLTALLLGGFGNYLIPLMVGARDMVFPFVNMLSYWVYLLSVIVLVASLFVPGGPTGGGWTLYPPQTILEGTPGASWGIIMMMASLAIFIVAFTMGGLNYVTTVLQARTRGMTLMRMPCSVWGIFVATIMGLLAFPALFVAAVMTVLDSVAGTSFFMPHDPVDGPADRPRGRIADPVPASVLVLRPSRGLHRRAAGVRHRVRPDQRPRAQEHLRLSDDGLGDRDHRRADASSCGRTTCTCRGMNPYFGFFFATSTLIIAIPTAIKVYNWLLTLWRGNIHLRVPMLFAIAFIFTFIHGGLSGLFLGNVSVDVPLSDTFFVVGHFHMVMGVSPILVIFGAIYHWYPKITGRMWNETPGAGPLLDHLPRRLCDLPADALPRHARRAAALLRARRDRVHPATRCISPTWPSPSPRGCVFAAQGLFFYQHDLEPVPRPQGRPQSVGRGDARMADARNARRRMAIGAPKLPTVYRWAYDYSVPGAARDFIPQNEPPAAERRSSRHEPVRPPCREELGAARQRARRARHLSPARARKVAADRSISASRRCCSALVSSAYLMRMGMPGMAHGPMRRTGARCPSRPCCGSTAASCCSPASPGRPRGSRRAPRPAAGRMGSSRRGCSASLFLAGQLLLWQPTRRCRPWPARRSGGGLLLSDHRAAWAAMSRAGCGSGRGRCSTCAAGGAGGAAGRADRDLLAFPAAGVAGDAGVVRGDLKRRATHVERDACKRRGRAPAARRRRLRDLAADWAGDQEVFRHVHWGKAMMWIFLLSRHLHLLDASSPPT